MQRLRLVILHLCTFAGGVALFALIWKCAERASPETQWIIASMGALGLFLLMFLAVDRDKRLAMLELAGELGKAGVAVTQARGGMFGGLGFGVQPATPTPEEDAARRSALGGGE